MTNNQLAGIALIVFGLIDLLIIPKFMDTTWRKVKRPPPWTESFNMVVRFVGVLLIVFGISYYFYGQLE